MLGWEKQAQGRKGWLLGNVIPSGWRGKVPAVGAGAAAHRPGTARAFIEMGAVILTARYREEFLGFFLAN